MAIGDANYTGLKKLIKLASANRLAERGRARIVIAAGPADPRFDRDFPAAAVFSQIRENHAGDEGNRDSSEHDRSQRPQFIAPPNDSRERLNAHFAIFDDIDGHA